MAKPLATWFDEDVAPYRDKSIRWLSEQHFFRDPSRAVYSNPDCFFSPADGVILYQKEVDPDESVVDIKGRAYTLQAAMRMPRFTQRSLVIGIFMTFFDVHINRVPYPGRLSYRELDTIDTYNYPMLNVEKDLLDELTVAPTEAHYLFNNQRVLNRVFASNLQHTYYVLQIADYDVDCITPFELKQNMPLGQNQRFSQIRYGSQVDLIIPLSSRFGFEPLLDDGMHVEAGVDPLVRITRK